jgi:hypothetical protein
MSNSRQGIVKMSTYSQIGQDLWVLSHFPINNGYFVDIGFYHPIRLSNTYLLEQNGWSGIGVDPIMQDLDYCSSIRPNTKFYNYAVYSDSDLELEFGNCRAFSGIVNCLPANSRTIRAITKNPSLITKTKTKTLYSLLIEAQAPNFIHYLSLDTEGSEFEILKNFPFDKFKFGSITVEHNKNKKKKIDIKNLLEDNNYVLHKTVRFDDWYINKNI